MKLKQLIRTCFPNFALSEKLIDHAFLEKNYGQFLTSHRKKRSRSDFPEKITLWDIFTSPTAKGLDLFVWPGNLFSVLFSIVKYTDKYRKLVSFSPDRVNIDKIQLNAIKSEWESIGDLINKNDIQTPTIKAFVDYLFSIKNIDRCVYDLMNDQKFIEHTMTLIASIDECFANFFDENNENNLRTIHSLKQSINEIQSNNTSISSSLSDMLPMHGFVCTKKLSSQSGLTINSLTHNITLIPPTVRPNLVKFRTRNNQNKKRYNILYIPYPFSITESCFKEHLKISDTHGYFTFKHTPDDFHKDISEFITIYENTKKRVSTIDLIILPECSLSKSDFELMKQVFHFTYGEHSPDFLVGTWEEKNDNENRKFIENKAEFSYYKSNSTQVDETVRSIVQRKHHRWFLDRDQIKNYLLAGVLDSSIIWWENIDTPRRELSFAEIDDSFTICPLICEDLARQEPVASTVRAVGPSLVVSLLLDGPQLKQRWPGKYASVLADDPGSSVLTVSPLGMVNRSIGSGHKRISCVALWSEKGYSKELILDEGAKGLLLELSLKDRLQWSLDSRVSERIYPSLDQATSIYLDNSHLGDVNGNL